MQHVNVFARQAAAQYGLLSIQQLRKFIKSDNEITRLLDPGVLERHRRGLYRIIGSSRTWHFELMAACLSTQQLTGASHRSSMRLWGLRTVDDEIEVSVRYPADLSIPGVITHRIRDLSEHDITYIDAIPVTSPARTLCDAGLIFGDQELGRMTHHALAKGIVTIPELWRYRERVGRRGRNGVGPIERVLEGLPPDIDRAESGPEIAMRKLCEEYHLPAPVWQHCVVACGNTYRIDFAYPEHRIAIEYDGFLEHTRPEAFVQDRRRQNDLQECGWMVLRFVWSDLRNNPADVARRISQARRSVSP